MQIECTTDRKIFQQIIINLLSNAIKFTKKGSITVSIEHDAKILLIQIIDTGIGISKEDMKLLFNDFTQVENLMQKQQKGTGLGLSLSKKMAKLISGDIKMQSDGSNKGTTVTLRFIC